jgi:hypothetical protein
MKTKEKVNIPSWTIRELKGDKEALKWLLRDYWSLSEGLALMGKHEIIGDADNSTPALPLFIGNRGEDFVTILRAIKSKKLKEIKPRPEAVPVYSPYGFIQFAIQKKLGEWKYWRALLKENPLPAKVGDWKARPFKEFEAELDHYGNLDKCAESYGVSRPTYTRYFNQAKAKVGSSKIYKQK